MKRQFFISAILTLQLNAPALAQSDLGQSDWQTSGQASSGADSQSQLGESQLGQSQWEGPQQAQVISQQAQGGTSPDSYDAAPGLKGSVSQTDVAYNNSSASTMSGNAAMVPKSSTNASRAGAQLAGGVATALGGLAAGMAGAAMMTPRYGYNPYGFSPYGMSPFGMSPYGFGMSSYANPLAAAATMSALAPKVTSSNPTGQVVQAATSASSMIGGLMLGRLINNAMLPHGYPRYW